MEQHPNHRTRSDLRPAPVRQFMAPLRRFLHIEASSGIVLFICTVLAFILANSALHESVHHFWETSLRFGIGNWELNKPLHFWVNDALMTIFFFVVGLEIKRELVAGELNSARKAALPVFAALGGMIVPAGLYLLFQHDGAGVRGWGIPMATDIAFVVGVLALFGPRVPFGLKIFLLSLAIVDDMGAVLVIAVAYTEQVNTTALALAIAGFVLIALMNRGGVRAIGLYLIVGALIWLAVLKSGIHPTIAGVILGLMTPAKAWLESSMLRLVIQDVASGASETPPRPVDLPEADLLGFAARESVSPLERLESALHPWVGFLIMPLFALANAGVEAKTHLLTDSIALTIAASLLLGKTVGIFAFGWLAVKLRWASLPTGVTWRMLLAASVLGGIGFTMSLFVAGLAFTQPPELVEASKTGILMGSALAALLGGGLLWWSVRR